VLLRQGEAGRFVVSEASYAPRTTVAPHEHAWPTITLVLDGLCHERMGTRTEELTPSSVLIKPGAIRHGNDIGADGSRGFFIAAPQGDVEALCRNPRVFARVAHHTAPALARLGHRVRTAFWDASRSDGVATEEAILDLLAELGEEPLPHACAPPAWLRAIRDRLAAEFVAPPSLGELARDAGVHATYLGRAFRRQYGMGPGHLVHSLRVERAARALASGAGAISEIAFATGFADQSHLGRVFKRFMGMSPAAYRRSCRASVASRTRRVA